MGNSSLGNSGLFNSGHNQPLINMDKSIGAVNKLLKTVSKKPSMNVVIPSDGGDAATALADGGEGPSQPSRWGFHARRFVRQVG